MNKYGSGGVLAAGLMTALLVAGCATGPEKKAGQEGPEPVPVPTEAQPDQAAADKQDNDSVRLYPGTGVLVKAPQSVVTQQKSGDLTLSFEGADMREVVKTILSDILKESYIMDPRVGGSVTLHTRRPIPRAAVLPTLETLLRMNGAVLLRQEDGVYQVIPAALAGKGNLTPRLGEVGKPLPAGYSITVVPLKYIGAADMAKLLEPLGIDPTAIRMDLLRNLLILSGTEPEIRHMLETVDMFDVDWVSGMSVGLFTLKNVEVKTIAKDLEKVFGDGMAGKDAKGGTGGAGPLAGLVRLVPLERLNAILVVTPQAKFLEQARTWVERLDRGGLKSGGQSLFVYPVQNGKAEHLAGLLGEVFGQKPVLKATPAPSVAPGLVSTEVKSGEAKAGESKPPDVKLAAPVVAASASASSSSDGLSVPQDVRIIADKDNNALLILAPAADYERIEAALRKLDVVPRQVLIEVTIAEITLKDELTYGLEWFMTKGRISSQLDAGKAGIAMLTPGLAYSWTSKSGDITAILNLLATDSKLKIISSPHITVADNQTAKIQVGDQVPTITQTQTATSTTNGVISSVQYLDTGVLLSVTPRVNAGGLVTMEINQEISSASKTSTSNIDSPTIQKRSAKSTVTVQSDETLVMAGLITETQNRASDGLPLLSEIPLLGGLFGTQSRADNRTELIILITPRVLHSTQQASEITEEYRKRLSGLEDLIKTLGPIQPVKPDPLAEKTPAAQPVKLKPATGMARPAADPR